MQFEYSQIPDNFHYGAPMNYFPRFFVAIFLALACIGNFIRTDKGQIATLVGLISAFLTYLNWWISSYQQLKGFSRERMDFLNSEEFNQTAYLWLGNWLDVFLVATIFVALILQSEKFATKIFKEIK